MLVEVANGALAEGDPTGALQVLATVETLDPKLPDLYHTRALAFVAKKELDEALKCARKAVELAPEYSGANNTLGKLLMDRGEQVEAEKYLTKAAKDSLYREAYKANTSLGIMYYRKGELEKADQFLARATDDSPMLACVAQYYRGHIQVKQGNFKDALKSYDVATHRFCGNFADAHLAYGIALERTQQYDQARKKFLEIKKAFPNTKVAEQAMEHLRYLP